MPASPAAILGIQSVLAAEADIANASAKQMVKSASGLDDSGHKDDDCDCHGGDDDDGDSSGTEVDLDCVNKRARASGSGDVGASGEHFLLSETLRRDVTEIAAILYPIAWTLSEVQQALDAAEKDHKTNAIIKGISNLKVWTAAKARTKNFVTYCYNFVKQFAAHERDIAAVLALVARCKTLQDDLRGTLTQAQTMEKLLEWCSFYIDNHATVCKIDLFLMTVHKEYQPAHYGAHKTEMAQLLNKFIDALQHCVELHSRALRGIVEASYAIAPDPAAAGEQMHAITGISKMVSDFMAFLVDSTIVSSLRLTKRASNLQNFLQLWADCRFHYLKHFAGAIDRTPSPQLQHQYNDCLSKYQ